jgi:hypothetical protein
MVAHQGEHPAMPGCARFWVSRGSVAKDGRLIYLCTGSKNCAHESRQHCISEIRLNPWKFNEATFASSVDLYCRFLENPDH